MPATVLGELWDSTRMRLLVEIERRTSGQRGTQCVLVGIAEQQAVTGAAGLAMAGLHPVVAIYSTFLQRAYDQVVHDVAIQKLPVRFAIDRAGLVGQDGQTHAGSFDIAYLGCLPDFVIMAAGDEADHWTERKPVHLRGRGTATRLATPLP